MIDIARRHSRRSDHEKYWHCAVVFRHGRALSIGVNTGYNHAERDAILAVKNPKGCDVMSVRFSRRGELRMARPCDECRAMMQQKGMKRVMYSDERGQIQEEKV